MLTFVSIVHVLLSVFMIFVILLQPGKDAGMGAALGGGAASSAFGGRGAVTFLSKVTAACAIAFFVTSLGLSFVGLRQSVAAEGPPAPAAAPASTPDAGAAGPAANLESAAPASAGTIAPAPETPPAPPPAPPAGSPPPEPGK
ncbi:MAG: preprotein translocase subunit SecG [Myxococcales bacterium]|nr:preprotein translocase subunit SecG [Myxococcales bacterium]